MAEAQHVTIRIRHTFFKGGLEYPAHRRPVFVDAAQHVLTQLSLQCDAPWILAVRALHYPAKGRKVLRQLCGNTVDGNIIALSPVKAYAIVRATNTAPNTGVFIHKSITLILGSTMAIYEKAAQFSAFAGNEKSIFSASYLRSSTFREKPFGLFSPLLVSAHNGRD